MYHKINSVTPLSDFRLLLHFSDGSAKEYDMKPLHQLMSAGMVFRGTTTSILMVKSFG